MMRVSEILKPVLLTFAFGLCCGSAQSQTVMEMACALNPGKYKECSKENLEEEAKKLEEEAKKGEAKKKAAKEAAKEEAKKKEAKKEEAYEKDLLAYRAREKTIIEQVLNYTIVGDENGAALYYFVSGEKGGHKCIVTQRGTNDIAFEWGQIIDIRNMNEKGFEIRPSGQAQGAYRVGDEQIGLFAPDNVSIGRIQKGWGLVFSECPGKKSAF